MQIAINIDGQFRPMAGVEHYVDSLLGALCAAGTPHQIVALATVLSPDALHSAARDGLFDWLDSPRARVDIRFPYNALAERARIAQPLQPLLRTLDRRLLRPGYRIATTLRGRDVGRQYDVLHLPMPSSLWFTRYATPRQVVTLYDMTTRRFPQTHRPVTRINWERFYAYAQRRCARVLTISESTKNDIVEMLRIPAGRVDVTPLAPRASARRVDDPDTLRNTLRAFDLENAPFVLYAGTLEGRKNLPRLLRAFAQAVAEARLPEHKLVLAGKSRGTHGQELRRLAQELGIAERVTFAGYVSNQQMNALMSACDAFAYVSLYEGFGLPPLEAMVCGAPVVTSNTSSLPEVVGDAGLSVDPESVEQIAEALHHLLTDRTENARRRTLSAAQATRFSWERTATLTLQSYEAAAA